MLRRRPGFHPEPDDCLHHKPGRQPQHRQHPGCHDARRQRLTDPSFDASDDRTFDIGVAGSTALLAAKKQKIRDRSGTVRSTDKDALHVLRILRGTTTDDLASRMHRLLSDYNVRPVAEEGLDLLGSQFANRAGEGLKMAVRAVGVLDDLAEFASSCEALAGDVLRKMGR